METGQVARPAPGPGGRHAGGLAAGSSRGGGDLPGPGRRLRRGRPGGRPRRGPGRRPLAPVAQPARAGRRGRRRAPRQLPGRLPPRTATGRGQGQDQQQQPGQGGHEDQDQPEGQQEPKTGERGNPPRRKPGLAARTRPRHAEVHQLLAAGHPRPPSPGPWACPRPTVAKYARAASPGEITPAARDSALDPFKPYLIARWNAGARDATVLHAEIAAQGYQGSDQPVRRFVRPFRDLPARPRPPPAIPPPARSPAGSSPAPTTSPKTTPPPSPPSPPPAPTSKNSTATSAASPR